jgi:hypothetical protein
MSTKGVSNRGFSGRAQAGGEARGTHKPKSATKPKESKKAEAPQRAQRQQRAGRAGGAGGAGPAGGMPGANPVEAGDEADAANAAGIVGEVDFGDGLHRRRSGELESLYETNKEEEVEEAEQETGATGVDSVKRGTGGDSGGSSDGFDQGQQQREAYERLLKGNVKSDQERLAALRAKGLKDGFNPDASAGEVEKQGMPRLAAHVVRRFDALTLKGASHTEAVRDMAAWISQLSSPQQIRKLLTELESKPIRDVYPLELLMHLLEHRPELLPGVKKGCIVGDGEGLAGGKQVFAGHAVRIEVPKDNRLKSFALLGGGRPGYEFHPTPGDDNTYTLLIDTPGRWKFALLAAPLVSLGRIQKESSEAILEVVTVVVYAMGKKGEPVPPEVYWEDQQALAATSAGDDDDDVAEPDDAPVAAAEPAPLLIQQIRRALDGILKDRDAAGAQTYSWDVRLYAPGAPMDGDGILHLVVSRAGPFDPVWARAREALMQRQREYEPGRALITQEDVASALRRARARD